MLNQKLKFIDRRVKYLFLYLRNQIEKNIKFEIRKK